jgi:hypothetical protein
MMKQVCETLEKKVAMKMLADCPAIILEMGRRSVDEDDISESRKESFIEGEVTEIKTEQFLSLQVKDKNGIFTIIGLF